MTWESLWLSEFPILLGMYFLLIGVLMYYGYNMQKYKPNHKNSRKYAKKKIFNLTNNA